MDQKENLIEKDLSLVVVLPGGVERMTTVHGSKPLMDLLVTLCATYHLNPSSHTLELVTAKRNNIKLKPNALIGTLDAEKIILKPKGEDKNKKTSPQMPEATVRMVINYRKTQKTILRVNPRVALAELLPAICEKCEFDTETTVLLKDVQSLTPLDLSSSLNDYAIREVYARDTKGQTSSPVCPSSPSHAGTVTPGKAKNQKEKENKGLFSLFRKSKKNSDQASASSAPASPVLVTKPRPLSMALPSTNASPISSPTFPSDMPKKRRAPQPPILVSQSSVDLSACRTLNYEANTQLDGDQMPSLSRGSSAESSLKRTKRKAPPPPTSHSAVVQEMVPLDENLQGGSAANTLEEIMEQEELTPSVMSTTAVDTQGEDSSRSISADVSLHSQSPDTEIVSTASMEGSGEDQSCDLSSDGNQLKTTGEDSATVSDERAAAGTNSSELVDTNGGLRQFENISEQTICEVDCSVESSSLPQPGRQAAEAQVTVQANTETLREQNGEVVSPVAVSTSRLIGEDVQVQTDFPQLPASPEQHADRVPATANAHASDLAGKKNMATLTDELQAPDLKTHTSKTSSCHDSAPSTPVLTQASCGRVTDSEPKPKPSNELTRDYIPKVGMTTYTIVPQKSLEKLRYFEVALTLEAPLAAPEEGPNIDSLQLEESTAVREKLVSKEKSVLHSTVPTEDLLNSTATTRGAVDGSISESTHSSSPPSLLKAKDTVSSSANGASQAEVKGIKIPPATKPKPGSFRLAQHKKIPGYYVTSAAEKNLSASHGSGQREAQGGAEIALPPPPPPPPPPVPCQEETTGGAGIQLSPKGDDKNMSMMRITRQSSLTCKGQSTGLSLEKLRNFTAPRPYSPTTPSRFAQAVSSAVKRSQSLSHGPKSPLSSVSPPFSPLTRSPPATEPKGSLKPESSEDIESKEVDKGSILQGVEGEPPSFSGIAQMEENSSP
ncbi:cordon-bleu protein-like 1b isoform X2 [Echeneis naucrates]|nr:cordon-bleu protein-like 1 isoform X2 [Echeneis naucrates]XP_029348811.1 cordon-bleu protein-like 1 isoform X2 [Echeneis naucrates]XP_029348812.1 cordon-bleu protein-like 1 isoform X2 [Echeneis naucrates]